ncbi:hypothetical protein [Candidatus Hodgkinia cicadicola]|uniref:hypothetical protein n=1 Tax=Candidatus Hodgkinia cicadicola TaxID=573658 RepID=UPI001788A930
MDSIPNKYILTNSMFLINSKTFRPCYPITIAISKVFESVITSSLVGTTFLRLATQILL